MPREFLLTLDNGDIAIYTMSTNGYYYREFQGEIKRISANDYVSAYELSLEEPFC